MLDFPLLRLSYLNALQSKIHYHQLGQWKGILWRELRRIFLLFFVLFLGFFLRFLNRWKCRFYRLFQQFFRYLAPPPCGVFNMDNFILFIKLFPPIFLANSDKSPRLPQHFVPRNAFPLAGSRPPRWAHSQVMSSRPTDKCPYEKLQSIYARFFILLLLFYHNFL